MAPQPLPLPRELIFRCDGGETGALADMIAATCKYLGVADAASLENLHAVGGALPSSPVPLSPTLIHGRFLHPPAP